MFSFAEKEEKRLEREKVEKQLFPLWLVNYMLGKTAGIEVMDYEEFINQTLSPTTESAERATTLKKTADEIMAEFMPLVEADRKKGG